MTELASVVLGGLLVLVGTWITQYFTAKREEAAAARQAEQAAVAAQRASAAAVHEEKKGLYRPLLALCRAVVWNPNTASTLLLDPKFHECAGGVIASGGTKEVVAALRRFVRSCEQEFEHEVNASAVLATDCADLEGAIYRELHGVSIEG